MPSGLPCLAVRLPGGLHPRRCVELAAVAERVKLGDGLIIGNMRPPAYTARAVDPVSQARATPGRHEPQEVVKYLPWAIAQDAAEARRAVRAPIDRSTFDEALRRLARGERAADVLDDRFVDAFALAGTAVECAAALRRHAGGGVTEVAVSCVGADLSTAMQALADALGAERQRSGVELAPHAVES